MKMTYESPERGAAIDDKHIPIVSRGKHADF